MKVETVPKQQPDVVITISWREAQILQGMCWNIGGSGEGRAFIDTLSDGLGDIHVEKIFDVSFSGAFR